MKKINVALVRLLQFLVFALFTFMVLVYFGAMILLPLDLIGFLIKLLGFIGFNGVIAALVAVPTVGYLGLMAYKIPGLVKMLIDTGLDLVNTGKSRVEAFNPILESIKV